ncbi:hypothetical protein FSARC_13058 [Fusarium sarcochroum]|uniref:Uncharacterized protein n=1 Tax=Fusarium sarcochroum TaxID=1208366 RepID=A0A8H4T431_9HYPO|nr:hypothetical protein FSARC_13058 [Fusarium sarcochroum]
MAHHFYQGQVPRGNAATSNDARNIPFINDVLRNNIPRSTPIINNAVENVAGQYNAAEVNTVKDTTLATTNNLQSPPLFEAPSTTCQFCERLEEQPSSRAFIQAHGYFPEWSYQCESERIRYQEPRRVLEENFYMNLLFEQWYLDRYTEAFMPRLPLNNWTMTFFQNLQRVFRTREERKGAARFHQPWIINNPFQSYHSWMVVRLENPVLGTSVEIPVIRAATLHEGRYYAGFPPGTYIFQCRNQIGFKGLVPWPTNYYAGRCRLLFPVVMKLFISVLQLKAGKNHRALYPEFDSLVAMTSDHSALLFKYVHDYWVEVARSGDWPDQEVRDNFISRPQVRELAWLLESLKTERSGRYTDQHVIEKLLVSATGCPLKGLARLWVSRIEQVGRRMLESGNSRELFVYEGDPTTENIHEFYSQPPFDGDPLNPTLRYLCTKFLPLPEIKRAKGESAQLDTSKSDPSPDDT